MIESLRYGPLVSWQAHRSAILALALTRSGALWTGGKGARKGGASRELGSAPGAARRERTAGGR